MMKGRGADGVNGKHHGFGDSDGAIVPPKNN